MATAYVYDPLYLEHDEPTHPENSRRLEQTMRHLQQADLLERLKKIDARDACIEEVAAVHDPRYIEEIRAAAAGQRGWLDMDTYVGPHSYAAALRAAGGLLQAVQGVLQGEANNAFALVRPPGHHAVAGRAMGFCLFNNVAIAARYARREFALERVLIVDFDLHHGNGTQDAFYEDPAVLYFSTHQYPYYPGTGHYQETGRGAGQGYTVNVPLPAGVGDAGYERVFAEILAPVARRYRPQLILASAGYDAHWADPLGGMLLSVTGYASMTRTLVALAEELCQGRLVLTLEGGYSLEALAASIAATFSALLGDEQVKDPLGPARHVEQPVDQVISAVKRVHGLAW
jgi:acetoin utilization deacetylase AcuC-like enzyme